MADLVIKLQMLIVGNTAVDLQVHLYMRAPMIHLHKSVAAVSRIVGRHALQVSKTWWLVVVNATYDSDLCLRQGLLFVE